MNSAAASAACLLSGSVLGLLSFWSTGAAARKRSDATFIEDALTTTPAQLRQLALQRARENLRAGGRAGRVFEQYVALQGNINSDRPVRYNNNQEGGGGRGQAHAPTPLAFDAAVYSATLRDRLYECRFQKSTTSNNTSNNNRNINRNNGGGAQQHSIHRQQGPHTHQSNNGTPTRNNTKGKVDCGERWRLIQTKRDVAQLDTLFVTGSGVLPIPVDSDGGSGGGGQGGGRLTGLFLGGGGHGGHDADQDDASGFASSRGQVELVGLSAQDLDGAARNVRDEFSPAFADESKTKALQNDHRALVLQAAGSNIELAQNDPVRIGTHETVEALVIGDPVTCVGLSRVDPKSGRMTMSAPSAPSPLSGGVDEVDDSRPFVLSRMDKMEIGRKLRRDASAHDTARLVFGVPAGVLFAAGAVFAGKAAFGVGKGGDATPG